MLPFLNLFADKRKNNARTRKKRKKKKMGNTKLFDQFL